MMVTELERNGMGRDTMMCGDPKTWFPMRVTYSREMKVKGELDRLGIECFVPMTYRLVDAEGENTRRELVPAINNLVFVRSTQERISGLKRTNEVLEPLRYMMDRTAEKEHEIMTVPDRQMENFLRVASKTDDSVMFLDEGSIIGKEGKRVRIDLVLSYLCTVSRFKPAMFLMDWGNIYSFSEGLMGQYMRIFQNPNMNFQTIIASHKKWQNVEWSGWNLVDLNNNEIVEEL